MRRIRSAAAAIIMLVMAVTLSGCLYPKDKLGQFQKPPKDAIMNVQAVIDQFQKDTGLLPMQNSEADTPIYEKFKVDFDKLQRMGYISSVPETAYEKGGSYYYLIINEETDPTVKLMNLVIYQQMNDLQASIKAYSDAHSGKVPAGAELYPGFSTIDFKTLGGKEPDMHSMFSGSTLTPMVDANGMVYLDYGPDIMQLLAKETKKPADNEDLRVVLVNNSDFVPVKSPVYQLVNGDPQAVSK
ncbi:hypothetical protein A8990_10159 [Paenibacillus taihuensis]|uniref:Lipoprotein n=1 Tax=Paenibacillus taihuensis TaxID=1156355 RepID=A0A3D9SEC0_9BACL|nr:hypothetical protein [Paenibacillus taihuensis]REE94268.1 hypothetical protein A8990_10159 [Paenibacillus taihuensis]